MKKLFLLCTTILLFAQAHAQMINTGFEQLRPDQTPAYWQPEDFVIFIIDTSCVNLGNDSIGFVTHDAHTGNNAYEIRVATNCTNAYSGNIGPKRYAADTSFTDNRIFFTTRPAALSFYYKLRSVQGDYGFVTANMEDDMYNAIGVGTVKLPAAVNWTKVTIPVIYSASDPSAYLRMKFSIKSDSIMHYGSRFLIDDLNDATTTGIHGLSLQRSSLNCFPQPAVDQLFITTADALPAGAQLKVTDAMGRLVRSEQVMPVANKFTINTAALIPGTYFIQLVTGNTIATGRFVK